MTTATKPGEADEQQDVIAGNLQVALQHLDRERKDDLDGVIDLYADDIVWEEPSRGQVLRTHNDIRTAYQQLGTSLSVRSETVLRRFATDQWVINESLMRATVISDSIPQLDFPVGTELSIRKLTLFEMRGGKICREINHTSFRPAGDPRIDHDDVPAMY